MRVFTTEPLLCMFSHTGMSKQDPCSPGVDAEHSPENTRFQGEKCLRRVTWYH